MNSKIVIAALALGATLAFPGAALAQHGGGSHGGGSRGGDSHVGAAHASSGYHAPAVSHGSYSHVGGRFNYGGHHFYGGPFYRHSYFYPRYGRFYGGLALGLFVGSLPYYYDTFYWGGVPYYYNDGTYYRYNDGVSKYEVVAPPYSEQAAAATESASNAKLFVYPKKGQSEDQQRTDRFECHQWAVNETGVDPSKGEPAAQNKEGDYRRAEVACLTGRDYSVR